MILLVWNIDLYLYDLRILRYISLLEAILFNLIYIMMVGTELDLYYNRGLGIGNVHLDDSAIFDVMLAIFNGYMLIEFTPTAFVNATIILKEMTMN